MLVMILLLLLLVGCGNLLPGGSIVKWCIVFVGRRLYPSQRGNLDYHHMNRLRYDVVEFRCW